MTTGFKTVPQLLYEQFIEETNPQLKMNWDNLPDYVKQAWLHVYLAVTVKMKGKE